MRWAWNVVVNKYRAVATRHRSKQPISRSRRNLGNSWKWRKTVCDMAPSAPWRRCMARGAVSGFGEVPLPWIVGFNEAAPRGALGFPAQFSPGLIGTTGLHGANQQSQPPRLRCSFAACADKKSTLDASFFFFFSLGTFGRY